VGSFTDNEKIKKSTRKKLQRIALKYSEIYNINYEITEIFVVEVDRLKLIRKLSDYDILV